MNDRFTRRSVLGTTATAVMGATAGIASADDEISIDDEVVFTESATIHRRPWASSRTVATVDAGTTATIVNGPETTDGRAWWGLHVADPDVWAWTTADTIALPSNTSPGEPGGGNTIEMDEQVVTTERTTVYRQPGWSAEVVDTLEPGRRGTVINGPSTVDGRQWWGIRFADPTTWAWAPASSLSPAGDSGGENPDEPGTEALRGTFRRPPADLSTLERDIDAYAQRGVTDLALNVFYHGETIYDSEHVTSKDHADGYLEEAIDYAHQKGMNVHAWLHTMYLWNPKYLGDVPGGHVLDGDTQVCIDGQCATVDTSKVTRARDGSWTAESGKLFASPFHDGIVGTIADVAGEVDGRFDVDGVMLDYVRFPKRTTPFGYGEASPATPSNADSQVHDLRVDAVTGMVDEVANAVGSDTLTAADVFASYYTSNSTAEGNKAQDWTNWDVQTPLDFVVPMCYGYDSYQTDLVFCADAQTGGLSVEPALAIVDGHDSIDVQHDVYDDYDLGGYWVWNGEAIDSDLP